MSIIFGKKKNQTANCARCFYHYNSVKRATTKRGTMYLCNGCALQFDQDYRRRSCREAVEMASKKKRR